MSNAFNYTGLPTSTLTADPCSPRARLLAALLWFTSNSAQISDRARHGEQVFINLRSRFYRVTRTFAEDIDSERFCMECEIMRDQFGEVIQWPEEVNIARKSEPRS
jgi:hypothetical protein